MALNLSYEIDTSTDSNMNTISLKLMGDNEYQQTIFERSYRKYESDINNCHQQFLEVSIHDDEIKLSTLEVRLLLGIICHENGVYCYSINCRFRHTSMEDYFKSMGCDNYIHSDNDEHYSRTDDVVFSKGGELEMDKMFAIQ
jgi:hypothetical protein